MSQSESFPINSVARNSIWVYDASSPPRFGGAPTIIERTRSHQMPDFGRLPESADILVELYVLDAQMPDASWLMLCERIRAADVRAPIVVFSGKGSSSDKEEAFRAGANAYVVKHELTELVETVKRLLLELPESVA
jgi:DNA-binding response OmpR family regulator